MSLGETHVSHNKRSLLPLSHSQVLAIPIASAQLPAQVPFSIPTTRLVPFPAVHLPHPLTSIMQKTLLLAFPLFQPLSFPKPCRQRKYTRYPTDLFHHLIETSIYILLLIASFSYYFLARSSVSVSFYFYRG